MGALAAVVAICQLQVREARTEPAGALSELCGLAVIFGSLQTHSFPPAVQAA